MSKKEIICHRYQNFDQINQIVKNDAELKKINDDADDESDYLAYYLAGSGLDPTNLQKWKSNHKVDHVIKSFIKKNEEDPEAEDFEWFMAGVKWDDDDYHRRYENLGDLAQIFHHEFDMSDYKFGQNAMS